MHVGKEKSAFLFFILGNTHRRILTCKYILVTLFLTKLYMYRKITTKQYNIQPMFHMDVYIMFYVYYYALILWPIHSFRRASDAFYFILHNIIYKINFAFKRVKHLSLFISIYYYMFGIRYLLSFFFFF